jgi:hypothetical protein
MYAVVSPAALLNFERFGPNDPVYYFDLVCDLDKNREMASCHSSVY